MGRMRLLAILPFLLMAVLLFAESSWARPQTQCTQNLYCQTFDYRAPYLTIDFQNKTSNDYTIVFIATLNRGSSDEKEFIARRFVRSGQTIEWLREDVGALSSLNLETSQHRIEGREAELPAPKMKIMREIAGPDGLVTESICNPRYYCLYSIIKRSSRIYAVHKFNNVPLVLLHTVRAGGQVILDKVSALPGPPAVSELFAINSEKRVGQTLEISGEMQFGYIDVQTDRDHVYRLPYQSGSSFIVSQGYGANITHTTPESQYALDWDMPEGTPILAVREGIVIAVEDRETASGLIPAYLSKANSVRILHDDGTIASYAHLVKDGARVEEGRRVQEGEIIGFSGNTGFSSGPHLHFAVAERTGPRSPLTAIPTLFNLGSGQVGHVQMGQSYRAP